LYYISNTDLQINPIVENAQDIRDESSAVCDITFQTYDADSSLESYVDDVINSIGGVDCGLNVCNASGGCEPITRDDNCASTDEGCIIGYMVSCIFCSSH